MPTLLSSVPLHTQQRVHDRLSRSFCSQSRLQTSHNTSPSQQHPKQSIIKKIVMISSIKPEVKKIFLKYIELGNKVLTSDNIDKIINYSRSILDNDQQQKLSELLSKLAEQPQDATTIRPCETVLTIVREFVISPVQKMYIGKIEKQLKEDQMIDEEIRTIEKQIHEEKTRKLKMYQLEKSGVSFTGNTASRLGSAATQSLSRLTSKAACNDTKQVQNYQNKLMRANQKLNELSSHNNKLRERINQLRKQKNAMQAIYGKLKKQLQSKKQNVQNTIKYAGQAYCARNQAQEDLRLLKEQAETRKEYFRQQCEKLNGEIQHDIRFKQFIKSKQLQKEQLDKLEQQIRQNQASIEQKKQQNNRIDNEYQKSQAKQLLIKQSFARIKKQIGFGEVGQNQGKELLQVFVGLYQKNAIMRRFVEQITKEVQQLQEKIEQKKQQIQKMYLKGSAQDGTKSPHQDQTDHSTVKQQLKQRFSYQQKKQKILEQQYQNSLTTLQAIKQHLENIFTQIGIDANIIDKLRNCNLNQQNLIEYLGQLQSQGLEVISQYGKLVSEQLKNERVSIIGTGNPDVQRQIEQLSNLVALENMNNMNNCGTGLPISATRQQYPSELLIKLKEEKREEDWDKPLTLHEMKKFAIQSLEHYQRRVMPKQKHGGKKYGLALLKMNKKK